MNKILLAYSGGLDTSIILKWLINKGLDVICLIADVGQKEDFISVKEKAKSLGASKVYVMDLKKDFIEKYLFFAMQANAVYEGKYLLGTALARPLIAKAMVDIAEKENISLFSHGATGKGNDQVRFELTLLKFFPGAKIIAPWKDEEFLEKFQGREDLINYAKKENIPITSTLEKPYSIDANIMHTSFEGGDLENLSFCPVEEMFQMTNSLKEAPDTESNIAITFKEGTPILVEEKKTKKQITGPVEILEYLNEIGGLHGIGRVDIVESRFLGLKSRGVYETPGGTILWKAHHDLEAVTLDKEVIALKEFLSLKLSQIIYNGFWFSPEMEFLKPAILQSQKSVSGTIELGLYKGNIIIKKRKADKALYDGNLASMNNSEGFDQQDAKGFIKLQALRLMQGAL